MRRPVLDYVKPGRSLSARLLVLTILFVMLSEVLIFAPSVARYRITWLEERVASAHLAALALEATPDNMVSPELERQLLRHAGALMVSLRKPGRRVLALAGDMPPPVDAEIDLRETGFMGAIMDSFAVLARTEDRVLRVLGQSPKEADTLVEVALREAPLQHAIRDFAWRILLLSILIATITAALVYLALAWLMVRPVRRLTDAIASFRANPEAAVSPFAAGARDPRRREDEIGLAARELARMQEELRGALWQKTRLAALGTAVAKISHDLRGILATAVLVSDRISASADPAVRQSAPRLLDAIDRAVRLCTATLDYAREGPPPLVLDRFGLRPLLAEAAEAAAAGAGPRAGSFTNKVDEALIVAADREQLFRVFVNLVRNAWEAGARDVAVAAAPAGEMLEITLADDGPGLPERVRANLFRPFTASGHGSTGLGLAIARDLMRAHGGDIELAATGASGTRFRLSLPLNPGAATGAALSLATGPAAPQRPPAVA
ncbi:MAG: HAMP domain-containing histidine kinase [Alphaproteobacteria bacterium]|nr:HAMP domain-containing histidine kinase [Alphaproteobacteria bacterium]